MSLKFNKNELSLLLGYAMRTQFRLRNSTHEKDFSEKYSYRQVLLYMNFFRILLFAGFTGVISSIVLWETLLLYSIPITLGIMGGVAILAFYTNPYSKKYPFKIYQRITGLQLKLSEPVKLQIVKRTTAFLIFQMIFFMLFELPLSLFGVKLLMHV